MTGPREGSQLVPRMGPEIHHRGISMHIKIIITQGISTNKLNLHIWHHIWEGTVLFLGANFFQHDFLSLPGSPAGSLPIIGFFI